MQKEITDVWFHGTSPENATIIFKDGFRAGTWFARHMEDALAFGGPSIFFVAVRFEETPMEWQACSSNPISPRAIKKHITIGANGLHVERLATRMQWHMQGAHEKPPNRGKALAWASAAIEALRDIQREAELESQYADKLP